MFEIGGSSVFRIRFLLVLELMVPHLQAMR